MIISATQIVSSVLLAASLSNSVCGSVPLSCYSSGVQYYNYNSTSLGEEQQKSYARLNKLASYKADWNGNGAEPFSPELIDKCKIIVNELSRQPEIYPTAIDAIQFEYRKSDGSYIEFEIYIDKANVYRKDRSGKEYSKTITLNDVKKEVDAFYESK